MGQQNGLEQQHQQPQQSHGSRSKQDGAQTGAGGMAGRAGDGGHLQRGQDKGVSAHHGQQQNGLPVVGYDFFDGEKAPHQKGQADNAPGDGMALGEEALHNVHGAGIHRQHRQQRGNTGGQQNSAFPIGESGFHSQTPLEIKNGQPCGSPTKGRQSHPIIHRLNTAILVRKNVSRSPGSSSQLRVSSQANAQ